MDHIETEGPVSQIELMYVINVVDANPYASVELLVDILDALRVTK